MDEEFDYHLQARDQQQVERIVPLNQAKVHLAFRANITSNDTIYENGAVALSEHLVTICVRGFLGRNLKLLQTFHVFDIQLVTTINDSTVRIEVPDTTYLIYSPIAMRFARNLLRNFVLSSPMMPASMRFPFICHDQTHFPPFRPKLSPSQMFQFTYNANCSYYNTTYHHDVPRYFHTQLLTGNGLFDMNQLPIHLVECGLGVSADIRPITASLMFSDYVYGFNCSNVTRPDVIKAAACLVMTNSNLKILRLINTGAEYGCHEIAAAMDQSEDPDCVYWDFSNNHINDFGELAQALGDYQAQIITFKIDNCRINDEDMAFLLQSLNENENMYAIKDLSLVGNKLNDLACEQLSDYINTLFETDENGHLTSLSVGPVATPATILSALIDSIPPLKVLVLNETKINEHDMSLLIQYVSMATCLRVIDLSGCTISDNTFELLLTAINDNPSIETIALKLNLMKLTGKKFTILLDAISAPNEFSKKITELSLSENKLTQEELVKLANASVNLTKCRSVSLARNFYHRNTNVSSDLMLLIENCPVLTCLDISGNDSYYLQEEGAKFLTFLMTSTHLRQLNVSKNRIGDDGIRRLIELIQVNPNFDRIKMDGSNFTDLNLMLDLMSVISQCITIVDFPFPSDDIYNFLAELPQKDQQREFLRVSRAQAVLQNQLIQNRALLGMSDVSLYNDENLSKLYDGIVIEMQSSLDKVKLNEHLAITEIVGLPLPYELEDEFAQPLTSRENEQVEEEPENGYASAQLMNKIEEPESLFSTASFKTLQFNSLCIRRPDAEQRLGNKGKYILDNSDLTPPVIYEETEGNEQYKPSTFDSSNIEMPSGGTGENNSNPLASVPLPVLPDLASPDPPTLPLIDRKGSTNTMKEELLTPDGD